MKITVLTTVLHDIDNMLVRDVPVTSTVVEVDDKTLVIVDTGMYRNAELLESLKDVGYNPLDFNLVINTHLHPDHIGGNSIFKNARILVSREELAYERDFEARLQESNDPVAVLRGMGRCVTEGDTLLAEELKKLVAAYPVEQLVGDVEQLEFFEDEPLLPKNLSLLSVPGHSIDSRAVVLKGGEKSLIVAGDALYHRDLWRMNGALVLHYSPDLFLASAERISCFKGIIIPGHDRPFDRSLHCYLSDDTFYIG